MTTLPHVAAGATFGRALEQELVPQVLTAHRPAIRLRHSWVLLALLEQNMLHVLKNLPLSQLL